MIEVYRDMSALIVRMIRGDEIVAQATIRLQDDNTYNLYVWKRDEHGGERMGNISPEKWPFDDTRLRSTFSAGCGWVVYHGGAVQLHCPW